MDMKGWGMLKFFISKSVLACAILFGFQPAMSMAEEKSALLPVNKRLVAFDSQPMPSIHAAAE